MKKLVSRTKWLLLVLLAALSLILLSTGSASLISLNEKGNQAFAQQAYDEALAAYQAIISKDPTLPEPYFNIANILYYQGDLAGAHQHLQTALSLAQDPALVQRIFYNLGNTYFQALELDAAVQAYSQALLIDPNDEDARHNLELALLMLQQAQAQEQPQEQPPQEKPPEDEPPPESQQETDIDQSFEQKQMLDDFGQQLTETQARQLLKQLEGSGETLRDRIGTLQTGGDSDSAQDW